MTTATQMQIESKEINPCTVELTIKCSPEQVRSGYDKAFRRASKRVKVPGFRPGSAPKAVLKNYVDMGDVNRLAAENIVRDAYESAIQEQGLKPVGRPSISLEKLDEDSESCEFTAKVPLEAKVELGQYVGLEADQPDAAVTDEEVASQIQSLRERKATRKSIEHRGAQIGDFAVVGIVPEGEETGRNFMTVVGQTFPQLDQTLTGMAPEDAKAVDLTFPEEFQEKDWAGKPLKVQVTLRSLSAPELPELSEDFAKSYNAESVEELEAKIRTEMARAKSNWVQDYVNEQLLDALMKSSTIHVADTLWEDIAERRVNEIVEEAAKAGKTIDDVATEANMTPDQIKERFRNEAQVQVKRAVAIREIFVKEDMKLSQEDIGAQVAEIARENDMTLQAALQAMKKAGSLGELEFRAMFQKVMAFLTEKAHLSKLPAGGAQ
jgi:trigger factor